MFLGEFIHTIDDKGRLTIPAKFRTDLAMGLVVTRGMDRCLVMYPMDAWRKFTEQIANLPMTDRLARDFRRLVYAGATDTAPDKQGRINIPQTLRDSVDLNGQAIIVGCDTYLEIWSPEEWEKVQARVGEADADVERWATLGI
ncbi:MAG: division/cell wall cluster transcriptional repressor MraZ [Anaerolineae bacterium]|nr:division/cell wall cluster transcriptional repressor MraZ [Anaerolineae bacterium]